MRNAVVPETRRICDRFRRISTAQGWVYPGSNPFFSLSAIYVHHLDVNIHAACARIAYLAAANRNKCPSRGRNGRNFRFSIERTLIGTLFVSSILLCMYVR